MMAVLITIGSILAVVVAGAVGYFLAKRQADKGFLPQYRTWRPHWVPLTILIDDELTEEVLEALKKAIEFWNEQIGFRLFHDIEEEPKRVGFYMIVVPKTDGKVATTKLTFDREDGMISSATVKVRQDVFAELNEGENQQRNVMAHELGHCLGLAHDHIPISIMHPKLQAIAPYVTDPDTVLLRRVYRPTC